MPAYFKWHHFTGFLVFFPGSSIVQHKKKDKTIYTKGLHGSAVMFPSGVIYLSYVSTSPSVAQ